jgi:hypothetical protein
VVRLRRTCRATVLGVRVDSHLALGPRHRIAAGRVDGDVVLDSTLMPTEPSSARSYLYVVLAGTLHLRRAGLVAPPGTLVMAPSRDHFARQRWFHCAPSRILAVQVDAELLPLDGSLVLRPLRPAAIAAARRLHAALSADEPSARFIAAHDAFFAALRRQGVPVAARALRIDDVPSRSLVSLSKALSRSLSLTGTRPALIDVATLSHLSERTARRAVPELARTHAYAYANWRSLRRAWSTVLACVLLTAEDATPAIVARLTGFAAPASLCNALRRAGLPSPRVLQRRARAVIDG